MLTVNLATKLIAANRKVLAADTAALAHQTNLDAQIEKLRLGAEATFKEGQTLDAAKELGFSYVSSAASRVNEVNKATAHLPQDRVFTKDAIKRLCLTYGLRFLPTEHYKGHLDGDIHVKLVEFKALDKGHVREGYRRPYLIAAPSVSFNLTPRPKDPLLFAQITNDRFYLIHKWGDDLSVFARVKNWAWYGALAVMSVVLGILGTIHGCQMPYPHEDRGILVVLVSLAAGVISTIICLADGPKWGNRITDDNWDSPFSN